MRSRLNLTRGVARAGAMLAVAVLAALPLAGRLAAATPPAGPPYPAAVTGQRVYDYAGLFKPETISQAESIIAGIDKRTGAQVAVHTQVKPQSDSLDKANADALALMNQWGVGRKGIDDGLVILFDMQPNLQHGQVSLYAGSGFRAAFLSDSDRQAIFDGYMKPLLKWGDMDGGLMAGLREVDAAATPEHAAALEQDRFINSMVAVIGLLIGLAIFLWAAGNWLRHGRDPVVIDDSSILMPAPPADLTPAMATLLLDEKTSDRTVTAGLVDLAAGGCIAFTSHGVDPNAAKAGVKFLKHGDDVLPAPEAALRDAVAAKGKNHDGEVPPSTMYRLGNAFDLFKSGLEKEAVAQGWMANKPSDVRVNWELLGGAEIVLAGIVAFFWLILGASGILVAAAAIALAGIATMVIARWMPARTRQGSLLWSMLAAYRRTLRLTLAQAASMGDVVKAKALPWVTTPDEVMAWGVAFGLEKELESVMTRSMVAPADEASPAPSRAWQPSWWLDSATGRPMAAASAGKSGAGAGGMFSATRFPDPGSMIAALGAVSNPGPGPSYSSGSSSSSSFGSSSFGGGGGGGGGGAGGGF